MDSKDLQTRLASLSPAKRALLELKLKQRRTGIAENVTIPRRANSESAPLSFAQQRLWFLSRMEPESCVYNERSALRLDGVLNLDALHRAINAIVARHEVLRTTYAVTDGGEPLQRIGAAKVIDLPVIDVSEIAEHRQDYEVERIATELRERPFDLGDDLPLRLALIKLTPTCHVLIEVKHHIASDGWSSSVFTRELAVLYNCLSQGLPSPLPELPIQYADYAVWQRERLQGAVLEKQLAFWMAQLKEVPVLELPADRPRQASSGNAGAKKFLKMSQSLIDRLQTLSRREGTTLFMTLLAAFQVLLHRYTGQDDIAVGSPIAGRTRKETEGLIGFFVNMLVLRTELQGNPSFRELLTRVREIALQAYEHQDLPFEKLVEELNPDRNQSQTPLFQVVFAVQNAPRSGLELSGLKVSPVEIESFTAKFDISAAFVERDGEMNLRIEYRTDLFEAATIERMLGHFQNLLEAIVANPEQRISELPLLSEGEKHQLLFEWNATQKEYPRDIVIHELFEEQVEKTPDAVALVFEDQQLTYRELNHRANQLAHYLRKRGVGPNVLVGICLERSPELIVGLLGVLKAGGAYVPLDPTYPRERLLFMLEDSQVRVLITQEKYLSNLEYCTIVGLDRDWRVIANESANNPQIQNGTGDLAYVIYTSGSTGKPKGTLISHRNVARLFDATEAWFHFDASDVWTLFHSFAFDFSVWEMWGALRYGGKLIIVTDETRRSPQEFTELLIEHHVTVLNQTPSAFRQLMPHLIDSKNRNCLDLRFVIFGGEALELQSLKSWWEFYGDENPQLINMYGITETTVHVTYRPIRRIDIEAKAGSVIGKPIPDLKVYLLDKYRALVPIGVTGEIYVGGAGVAKGYLGRDELTAERFVAHPFSDNPQTRLYRSGDLARWLPSGDLEYLGRVDDQVKIRGFRIELGEIESVLTQHPAIQQAVVLAREDTPGDKRLVAYVVAALGAIPLVADLRGWLQQRLPEYMVPSTILSLRSMPLTANGKVDRRALPMPDQSRPELDESHFAPRTPIEKIVVNIWARILKLDKVGIDDNFFDLGGHSLLATQVISRLNDAFSIDLQLRRLFETPTVAGLVAAIDACLRAKNNIQSIPPIVPRAAAGRPTSLPELAVEYAEESQRVSILVELTSGGNLTPIWSVPGIYGNTLGFADLARELGSQQPFFALEAVGLSGAEPPLECIEQMAKRYISEIRSVQPHGPYALIGACFGATVAYEIARQILDAGEEVGFLGLLDPTRHDGYEANKNAISISRIVKRAKLLGTFLRGRPRRYPTDRIKFVTTKLRSFRSKIGTGNGYRGIRHQFHQLEVVKANVRALDRYNRKPLSGRLRAVEIFETSHPRNTAGWNFDWKTMWDGQPLRHRLPGKDSGDTVSGNNAAVLAAILAERLRAVFGHPLPQPGSQVN